LTISYLIYVLDNLASLIFTSLNNNI
jgi:hypothetical protein